MNVTGEPSERPRNRRILVWLKRIGVGSVLLLFTVVLSLYIIQTVTSAQTKRKYPPPGQLVDVGGFRLHMQSSGTGTPTVVLDAGGGGGYSQSWALVQPEVAKFTRVISYDRAGLGWSDPGTATRTTKQMASELNTLLTKAGIPGPYVLVGHSLGGFNVRMFAHEYPDQVAGMVLVDSSQEADEPINENSESGKEHEEGMPILKLGRSLIPLGIARLFLAANAKLPLEMQAVDKALRLQTKSALTICDEILNFNTSVSQMRGWTLPSELPLAVLSHWDPNIEDPRMSKEDHMKLLKAWTKHQAQLARQSTNSYHLAVPDSGHGIHEDQPTVVIDAIRRVVESVRTQTKLVTPEQ